MKESNLIELVSEKFTNGLLSSHDYRGDATLIIKRDYILELAKFLKEDSDLLMNFLMDLSAVDYSQFGKNPNTAFFASSGVSVKPSTKISSGESWPGPPVMAHFTVVYHFYSLKHKHRMRLVVPLEKDDAELDSLTSVWKGADWLEREVWDMFGIKFLGHPNLKRILMYEEFEGHPLRKDYPIKKRQPLIGPMN